MTYEVKLHPNAVRFLQKLPKEISERIKDKLREVVRTDPFLFLEHYAGEDVYKLRIGQYRALIDVDFRNKILYVQVIDHRSRIYKR